MGAAVYSTQISRTGLGSPMSDVEEVTMRHLLAAVATYAYDQIDQARTELNAVLKQTASKTRQFVRYAG